MIYTRIVCWKGENASGSTPGSDGVNVEDPPRPPSALAVRSEMLGTESAWIEGTAAEAATRSCDLSAESFKPKRFERRREAAGENRNRRPAETQDGDNPSS